MSYPEPSEFRRRADPLADPEDFRAISSLPSADHPRHKFFAVGSVIGQVNAASSVWGSGVMSRDDDICPAATLLAVRGPLTRARAIECGADCPRSMEIRHFCCRGLFPAAPRATRDRRGGAFLGHAGSPGSRSPRRAPLSNDMQDPIEEVIDQISACELLASSSLHGLIASHAYGVPAVWIKFRPLPSGDDSKFHDYFLSIGREPPQPLRLDYRLRNAEALACRASLLPGDIDRSQSALAGLPFQAIAMTPAQLFAGIRDGNYHEGGIRCLQLLRLEEPYWTRSRPT